MQTHPRQQKHFVGHDDAEALIMQALSGGRMPHAWLVVGEEGIGKATLAYRFARFVLSSQRQGKDLSLPAEHPVFKLVSAGSHPDLMVLERLYDEKKRKLAQTIPVDDVRKIAPFLRLTSSQGAWRVVLIDGADRLNRNGQNALLKILEEPPEQSLILLTAESAAALLPTIRSRARVLKLQALDDSAMQALAVQEGLEEKADLDLLIRMAEGSAARLFRYAACDGPLLYKEWCAFLQKAGQHRARLSLAEAWAGKDQDDVYMTAQEIIFLWLQRLITAKAKGEGVAALITDEKQLEKTLYPQLQLDRLLGLWDNLQQQTSELERSNLDRKTVFINMLDKTAEALM